MDKVFLTGRITSDITHFGTETKGGVSFTLVTSRPVIKDGQVQKGEDGYTETYDQFHTIKGCCQSDRNSSPIDATIAATA